MKKTALRIAAVVVLILTAVIALRLCADISEILMKRSYPIEYESIVKAYSAEFDVPESIIYAVIRTESGFDPAVVSKAGAAGLMQITPDTYDWLLYLRKETMEYSLFDPETNIKYGVYFLSYLKTRFGEWETAFAAYNAGVGRVSGWLDDSKYSNGTVLTDIPYPETADYVKKVVSASEKYRDIYDIK